MLKKLQDKWKVNGWNLLLIILTFAAGGSLCGYISRKFLLFSGLEKNIIWVILYILLITILWPVCVIIISIPFGQFAFFKNYLKKIRNRFLGKSNKPVTNLAIFASGAGTNAKNIIEYFRNDPEVNIGLVVSNKSIAGVLQVAKENHIEYFVTGKDLIAGDQSLLSELKKRNIGFIILAGFLLKIPEELVRIFPKRIINIHPALLPAYGGKGMYGSYVHEAVIASKENKSGITIHYVDDIYDHGEIIFQSDCEIQPADTAISLAKKIQSLEHKYFPQVIEQVIKSKKPVKTTGNN